MKKQKQKRNKPDSQFHLLHEKRRWSQKFADAFRGLRLSVYRQSSYRIHFLAAVIVLAAAWRLGNFDTIRWILLFFCITIVIVSEMFNTAIETLAKAITNSYNPYIGNALDIAGGAVLVTALGAASIGIILFLEAIWKKLGIFL
ncbi:MAG: diacylglycerol kinase [Planctomycetaceae bacterium]|jgi:diacylglycerol kinase (ATP)|nr:diacylglycerol kinase [Planctomycetaceae bacterium]